MFQPGSDWNGPPMAVLLNKADLLQPVELEELSSWYKTNCRAQEVFAGDTPVMGSSVCVYEHWVATWSLADWFAALGF